MPRSPWLNFCDFSVSESVLDTFQFDRTYAAMAMLPIKQGQRRAVLIGGKEDSKQVIMVSAIPFKK